MIKYDYRIKKDKNGLLSNLIGKQLTKIFHDPFEYSNSVYRIVGLYIEDKIYKIENAVNVLDYYGEKEDVAVFSLGEALPNDIHSFIQDQTLIDTPVNRKIKMIQIVNEHQMLFEDSVQTYDVNLTRGIIIELDDGLQISFEKDIWFSEDINIEKGYDLITKFDSTEDFTNDWTDPYIAKYERTIISLGIL